METTYSSIPTPVVKTSTPPVVEAAASPKAEAEAKVEETPASSVVAPADVPVSSAKE